MSAPEELTSAQKGGRTKKEAYASKVRTALQQLAADPKRKSLFILDICTHAGVSADPIYTKRHAELRKFIDIELTNWALSRRKRPKRLPMTELEAKLEELEADKAELDRKLGNAQRALNVLGQMLETALSNRSVAAIVPIHRPRRDT